MLRRFLIVAGFISLLALIAFVDYGVNTQCPDVAVYVKCYDYE